MCPDSALQLRWWRRVWLSPCPKIFNASCWNYSSLVWKINPEVTALTFRLDKSNISGQTHQAASEFQLEPVEQQPICKRSVMVIPKYLMVWRVCGQSEDAQRAAGFEILVIKGQVKHQIYRNRLKSPLLHSCVLWALNKAEDWCLQFFLSARTTKSARQSLVDEPHDSFTTAGSETHQGGRFWAVSPIIFQSPKDLTAL